MKKSIIVLMVVGVIAAVMIAFATTNGTVLGRLNCEFEESSARCVGGSGSGGVDGGGGQGINVEADESGNTLSGGDGSGGSDEGSGGGGTHNECDYNSDTCSSSGGNSIVGGGHEECVGDVCERKGKP